MAQQTTLDFFEDPQSYNSETAAKIAGISTRQLDHWIRKKIIEPSTKARGSGTQRRYSYQNLYELRIAAELSEKYGLPKTEKIFKNIREDLHKAIFTYLVIVDGTPFLREDNGELTNVISYGSRQGKVGPGQGVLNMDVFNLEVLKENLDIRIVDFPIAKPELGSSS